MVVITCGKLFPNRNIPAERGLSACQPIANENCETWLPFLLEVRLTIPISHFMTPESSSHRDIPGLAIVVVGALCEGQFAIFDTDTSELLRFSEH